MSLQTKTKGSTELMPLFILSLFVLTTIFTCWLRQINLSHMKRHGATVPSGFESFVSGETLSKTLRYTVESSRLGLWESLFDNLLLVLFLFTGVLSAYDRFISGLVSSPVLEGVLFFIVLSLLQTVLEIPFSLYGTFVLEARHGFNTTTPRLWFTDLLKSQAIGSVITGVLLAAVFALMGWSPGRWWLWVWGFLAVFSLFMMFISPYVIEPLFNRFEPVTEAGLEDDIRIMMEKAGLKVGRVMQMDASKRSRHSNAYFTGIGRVKRIVLYDTLIRQMTHAEIVAVLAHEIGHWKRGHVWKRLLVAEILALAGSWLAYRALAWDGLPALLGHGALSPAARLAILGLLASLAMFPFTPLSSWLSRRDEYEADRFAAEITSDPGSLATALIKLSAENLSNLHPHPLYARFYYSHPPVVERVNRLMAMARAEG